MPQDRPGDRGKCATDHRTEIVPDIIQARALSADARTSKELLTAARNGDEGALAVLVERHRDRLAAKRTDNWSFGPVRRKAP